MIGATQPGVHLLGPSDPGAPARNELIDFWLRQEAAADHDAAVARLDEAIVVAVDDAGAIVGDATAYLAPQEQLRLTAWHLRVLVAPSAAGRGLAADLALATRDRLAAAFASGADLRAPCLVIAVESPELRAYDAAVWRRTGALWVGVDRRDVPIRVCWFPGAHAPPPP